MKKYAIIGLADTCSLCLTPSDGRAKSANGPVFLISCDGPGFSGPCCAQHVALLLKIDDPKAASPASPVTATPKPEARQDPKPNGVPVAAVPVQK